MKPNTKHLLAPALFSVAFAGCPFTIDDGPDACPPGAPNCGPGRAPTPDAQPPTPGECTPLVVSDPAVSLAGYTMYQPDEKRNNPLAGEPSYVYLAAGTEGVILPGPSVTDAPGLFVLQSPSIGKVGLRSDPDDPYAAADGYKVVVNRALAFDVAIMDFESEVGLARVELCVRNGQIESRFFFRGEPRGDGVAHQATITATANGVTSAPTAPVTIEVRRP